MGRVMALIRLKLAIGGPGPAPWRSPIMGFLLVMPSGLPRESPELTGVRLPPNWLLAVGMVGLALAAITVIVSGGAGVEAIRGEALPLPEEVPEMAVLPMTPAKLPLM